MRKLNCKSLIIQDAEYIIIECLGEGSSCVAYKVLYKESDTVEHYAILKEFCPRYLENYNDEIRDEDNSLIIPDQCSNLFLQDLNNFKSTYVKINSYLKNNLSATNYHSVQLGLLEDNNTAYTLTSYDYGTEYSELDDENIYSMLKIFLSITKAVEMYHNAGFLHLDIKPENVMILEGVTDLVKLFDYDSLTSIEQIKSRNVDTIPKPKNYYIPELSNLNYRNIGVATDICEIGIMLFEKLFGYIPKQECFDSTYNYDFTNIKLINGTSPKFKYELEELFKHTLQVSPLRRYKNIAELMAQFKLLISLVSDVNPYVQNMPKWKPSSNFVGRQEELQVLKSRLDNDGFIFIKAMGGTGKSELAKMFAEIYGDDYHTVQFCKYAGSLKALTSAINVVGMNDSDYQSLDELANEKNKILHQSDDKTLIIVDNFNTTYDEFLREFLPINSNGFKVIFTTRCDIALDYLQDKVYSLSALDSDVAKHLFYKQSGISFSTENDELIDQIIDITKANTLTLVLLSKSVKKTNISLSSVVDLLKKSSLDLVEGEVFHEYDYSSIDGNNYNVLFAHLNTIFSIANITPIQREILKDLTLIANIGIDVESFIELCENSQITENEIKSLIDTGWIEQYEEGVIVLHPVLSDLVHLNKEISKSESYTNLAWNLSELCYVFDEDHIDDINEKFSYLFQADKRLADEISFANVDIKLSLAGAYYLLYMAKEAKNKYQIAETLISESFRYKPRCVVLYCGLGKLESDFGSIEIAKTYFEKSIKYSKKTINPFYVCVLDSICGLGKCAEIEHNYIAALDYYNKAYNYIVNDSINDKFKSMILSKNKKDLKDYIPYVCDLIINVNQELGDENKKIEFELIKEDYQKHLFADVNDNERVSLEEIEDASKHLEFAKLLFSKGNLKDGLKEFYVYLDYVKDMYGEDSPTYIELFSDILPLIITANSSDGNIAFSSINESINFFKNKFGEGSRRYVEYLILLSEVLSEIKDVQISEEYAKKAKQICVQIGLKDSFLYQEANLVLISSLIIQNKIENLNSVVEEIDYSYFNSKGDYEKLVKYAGGALLELKKYEKAIDISTELLKQKNVTPAIYCVACYIISESYLEQENAGEALVYLKKEKPILDSLDDSNFKSEYLWLYYCALATVESQQGSYDNAINVLDECIANVSLENEYIYHILKCRLYILKTYIFRNMSDYSSALRCISTVESYLNDENTILKYRLGILEHLSICYAANGQIDKAINYFNEFESLIEQSEIPKDDSFLTSLVYFSESLLFGGSYLTCKYGQRAEELVDKLQENDSIMNARLQNNLACYLSDYENRHTLAREKLEFAEEILAKLDAKNTPLYIQVTENIEYIKGVIMDDIIKSMAKAMIEENEGADDNE